MSTGSTQPFAPSGTLTLAATTSAVSGALVGSGDAVLIYNASSGVAFVAFDAQATNAGTPIPPGARMLMACGTYAQVAGVVLSTGNGTVYLTRGTGTVY